MNPVVRIPRLSHGDDTPGSLASLPIRKAPTKYTLGLLSADHLALDRYYTNARTAAAPVRGVDFGVLVLSVLDNWKSQSSLRELYVAQGGLTEAADFRTKIKHLPVPDAGFLLACFLRAHAIHAEFDDSFHDAATKQAELPHIIALVAEDLSAFTVPSVHLILRSVCEQCVTEVGLLEAVRTARRQVLPSLTRRNIGRPSRKPTGKPTKTDICRNFNAGTCRMGTRCRFKHVCSTCNSAEHGAAKHPSK